MNKVTTMKRLSRQVSLIAAATILAATRVLAQHEHHPMQMNAGDTLVSAPTQQTRFVGDSAVVADSLLKLCKPHVADSIDAYSTCIGDGIGALSGAGNIALAMGVLDKVVNSDASLILLGHPLAHALGYAVRSTPATATRLLSQCDDRYQSGCYHGILQRYFDARMGMPLSQGFLTAPCDGLRGTKEQFRLFDCLHGTGHGLMMYHAYDVNASLHDCDRLGNDWDRRSCYGGVFMEHNMGARMQVFSDGAFGMHRHSMPSASVVLFKKNDLHYPCDATDAKYRAACYEEQADLILPAVQEDYKKAGAVCDGAGTPDLVATCYIGLGRNASGASAFQYAGIKKRCALASSFGAPFCYKGAVRHLAYAPSELPRGINFCKTLPHGDSRFQCWNGVGLQIGGFFTDLSARRRACESNNPADVEPCNLGAGVAAPAATQSPP